MKGIHQCCLFYITYGHGDVEIKNRGTIWTNPRTSQLQPKGRSLQYFSAKMKLIRLKHIESTFYTHETYKLRTHISHQKCPKTHVRPFGIHKIFPGVKPPDPHPKGRPRLTRPGRGASNAGRGGEGKGRREEKGGEGKGGEGRGMGGPHKYLNRGPQ